MSAIVENEDLNEQLLAIAQAFLARHESDAVIDDQVLFCRAVKHLQGIDVPMHLAERLVSHDYGELKSSNERRRLDNGLTWAVPVGLIVRYVINSPINRKLRLVEP